MSEIIPPLSSTTEYYRPVDVFVVQPRKRRYWLHAALLLATVFTTLVVGARMQFNFQHNQPAFYADDDSLPIFPLSWALHSGNLRMGIPFSGALMLILLAHEMGHYLYCRYYGVSATLPFFIPFPTLIGTLGAFIRIRSPIRSRAMLFDIGIAGPIAGFVVAVAVLFLALGFSKIAPAFLTGTSVEPNYPLIFFVVHGLLAALGLGHGTAGLPLGRVLIHPTAIAAWVGMFATALNLLPGGQLDGGHIVFSLAPRTHRLVSRVTIAALLPLAYFCWAGWLVWAVLLRISGMRHPMVPELPGIAGGRRWLAVLALLMLVLTFTPAPFAHSSLQDVVRDLRSGQ
ncbi:MAG: site-2 protease family protein [Acidobacteriia bacterium]|nr:site-2 protease family protein [Terriglobia bacterium]